MRQHQTMMDWSFRSAHPVRTLFRILDLRWFTHVAFITLYLIKHAPVLLMPVFLASMVAFATDPSSYSPWYFGIWSASYFIICLINIPTHMAFVHQTSRPIRRMEQRLRSALVRRLQQLSISFHTNSESGALQAKVLRDVDDISMLSKHVIEGCLGCAINLGWAIAIAVTTNPIVGLFMAVLGPVSAVLIQMFRKQIRKNSHEYRSEMENMSSRVSEMIDIIPVTRAHGLEDVEVERADGYLGAVYNRGVFA